MDVRGERAGAVFPGRKREGANAPRGRGDSRARSGPGAHGNLRVLVTSKSLAAERATRSLSAGFPARALAMPRAPVTGARGIRERGNSRGRARGRRFSRERAIPR